MAFSTDDATLKTIDQQDFYETTLKTAVTDATDTNIYLTALPTPTEGFLTIEPTSTSKREVIFYTSLGADYVTCPSAAGGRGVSGTAQGHAVSGVVRLSDAKEYWTVLRDRLLDVQTGWINADETWTCGADDVITVPTNATVKYSVGDKIFLQDDGGDLYGYVEAVAATSLTLVPNDDYTLASGSTITEPKYSKAASPVGFPQWFAYTTSITPAGTMTLTSVTQTCKFKVDGSAVTFQIYVTGTTGGNVNSSFSLSLPISDVGSSLIQQVLTVRIYDNSTNVGGTSLITTSAPTVTAMRRYDGANFTAGNCGLGTGGTYEI